ncbi:MAG: flavohemoglobin expression-modulating QEGLA motif protein [Planctomycetota bacterium]|nr:flavohemoglobin expression-modulating QEGLA motif protein [Planctomycetota bacterium]MDA1248060.1 flavohemoglobin expression-modulating QEGLA motif protein [Planctomycetota bacterium]
MSPTPTDTPADFAAIPSELIERVCKRLKEGGSVREVLPDGGLLSIDRLRPFLCVYRHTAGRSDAGTDSLVRGEASYLMVPGNAPARKGLRPLVRRLAETANERFGAFFIIELWASPDEEVPQETHSKTGEVLLPAPRFTVHERAPERPGPSVNEMIFALELIQLHGQTGIVDVILKGIAHPPGAKPLIANKDGLKINCFVVGLEILPVFRNPKTGEVFPDVLREMQLGVGRALRKAFFTFSLRRTNTRPEHWFALGRSRLPELVWKIDRQLSEIGGQFSFLLQVTPINSEAAWNDFKAGKFREVPSFNYRPLPADPLLLKRQVNNVRTEKVVDATLAHVLRQTQDELDRMLTMLSDVGTPRFLPGSLQIFGAVEPELLELARQMLQVPAQKSGVNADNSAPVTAAQFARRASEEIHSYQKQLPTFAAKVELREDMFSGLMVSSGQLLIGRETSVPAGRVEALLAHEVGTHLVTFYNGQAQPLRLLSTGLAGYDSLQEGLAVLSEHLVGGLTRGRLRMLAARVVAAHMMSNNFPFSETWQRLVDEFDLEQRSAWTVTMRVYRGGGLTKDAVYLRGLVEILKYIGSGGELDPLFIGKLAVQHVPVMQELVYREILKTPPLTPHYMTHPAAAAALASVRKGITVLDLFPS